MAVVIWQQRCGFLMLAALVVSHWGDRGMFSTRVSGGRHGLIARPVNPTNGKERAFFVFLFFLSVFARFWVLFGILWCFFLCVFHVFHVHKFSWTNPSTRQQHW